MGAWKDGTPDGLPNIHAFSAHFWSATGRIYKLQAPGSEHVGPGESELPKELCGESQVACINRHTWIDKSESKSMYWKSCCEHKNTGAGNEVSSKVNVIKLVI